MKSTARNTGDMRMGMTCASAVHKHRRLASMENAAGQMQPRHPVVGQGGLRVGEIEQEFPFRRLPRNPVLDGEFIANHQHFFHSGQLEGVAFGEQLGTLVLPEEDSVGLEELVESFFDLVHVQERELSSCVWNRIGNMKNPHRRSIIDEKPFPCRNFCVNF